MTNTTNQKLLFQNDFQVLKDTLTKETDIYNLANTYKVYRDLNDEINKPNSKIHTKNYQLLKKLVQKRNDLKYAQQLLDEELERTNKNLALNKEIYIKILKQYMTSLLQFGDKIPNLTYPYIKLSKKDIINILTNYLEQENNQKLDLFQNLIISDDLIIDDNKERRGGILYGYHLINSKIFLSNRHQNFFTIDTCLTIVHELEHLACFKYLEPNKTNKELFDIHAYNPFLEINTYLEEKKFINFLAKNNILKSDAQISLLNHYNDIFLTSYLLANEKINFDKTVYNIYCSYISDLLLDIANYDYEVAKLISYNTITKNNKEEDPTSILEASKDKSTKVLKRQYEQILF